MTRWLHRISASSAWRSVLAPITRVVFQRCWPYHGLMPP